jgi:hypothetical protein
MNKEFEPLNTPDKEGLWLGVIVGYASHKYILYHVKIIKNVLCARRTRQIQWTPINDISSEIQWINITSLIPPLKQEREGLICQLT